MPSLTRDGRGGSYTERYELGLYSQVVCSAFRLRFRRLYDNFPITFLMGPGKEPRKRFLSTPEISPHPSQGGDPDTRINRHIETVLDNTKLPHFGMSPATPRDHMRGADNVSRVSVPKCFLFTPLHVYLGRGRGAELSLHRLLRRSKDDIVYLSHALVFHIGHLTGLWEDDPRMMASGDHINATSRALSRTLFPFHYPLFVNHPQAPFDMKRKIRAALPPATVVRMSNITHCRSSAQVSERAR